MKDLILVGAGGCMRELVWQIQELNHQMPTWNILGYVDSVPPQNNQDGVCVGKHLVKYLGSDEDLLGDKKNINVVICIANPRIRRKIVEKYMQNPNIHFPNLILSKTCICDDVKIGKGCIISMDARISTNVELGDFVFMNTGSKVCHDGRIGSFVTLSPDVTLAGAVSVADMSEIGLGAKVKQCIEIGENTIIGAGAVVVRNIQNNCTAVGVPAKVIKYE